MVVTTRVRRVISALSAMLILLALATPAAADNVQNNVAVGGNDTITAGGTTTVSYRIVATSGDGQTGCNASDGSPAVVTINTPAAVIASPTSLSFSACSVFLPVQLTSSTPGTYNITVSVSDPGTGSYNTTPATFTLKVLAAPADTTPPIVTTSGNVTVEATGPLGAAATFTASANDNKDGAIPATCVPPSGSTFELGSTTVTCSATDAAGNTGSATLVATVQDTTAPVVTTSGDVTKEATGPSGAAATFTASATDAVDGSVPVTCVPASGSTFDLGITTVECSATDVAGNTGSATFDVTVVDTTAPDVTTSGDIVKEATGPSGAAATFTASATDVVDGSVPVTCVPASGSTFELGSTSVTCSATDAAGNTGTASLVVKVQDTTAPVVNVPSNITVDPTGLSGAVVNYGPVTATDLVSGELAATCAPASAATFGFGTTTVNCSATDGAGNTGTGTFNVTVRPLTLSGFYQPVDMGMMNTVKGGSTVPLKFEVFAGSNELTSTSAVSTFKAVVVSCSSGMSEDAIEMTTTGGTSLRYDADGGQFIQNWQTPKKPGTCYKVTMTTVDGTVLTANFKLK